MPCDKKKAMLAGDAKGGYSAFARRSDYGDNGVIVAA